MIDNDSIHAKQINLDWYEKERDSDGTYLVGLLMCILITNSVTAVVVWAGVRWWYGSVCV